MIIPIKKIMKYVKYIWLTLLGLAWLFSFSNANYLWWWKNVPVWTYVQMSDICNDSDNAWVNTYITFDQNLNIHYIENWIEYNWARFYACGWAWTWNFLYRNRRELTVWFGARSRSLQFADLVSNMWNIASVCITSKWSTCYTWNSITMSEFTSLSKKWESFTIQPYDELNWNVFPCNSWSSCVWWYNQPVAWCFNSTDSTYCVATQWWWSPLWTIYYNPIPVWEANINASIWDWSNYFSSSPVVWNNNNQINYWSWLYWYDYTTVDSWWIIDYFEWSPDYKFNNDICYIWTRDLTSVYEDRIPYYQWSWYTIYDFYWKLFNTNTFSVKQVWSFIDTRYINYSTWFMGQNRSAVDWSPLYNAYYSFWSWFRLDQWSWLVNPFLHNLTAYFFLWSTAYENNWYRSTTPWEAIVTYCLRKLPTTNNWSVSSDWSDYNIEDNHNKAYDNNASVYVWRLKNNWSYFIGANTIVAQSWDWTPLDYFDNWENITDFNWFFSSAFNKFKDKFWTLPASAFWVWFLPSYIIMFLLAIVFFRFLSH